MALWPTPLLEKSSMSSLPPPSHLSSHPCLYRPPHCDPRASPSSTSHGASSSHHASIPSLLVSQNRPHNLLPLFSIFKTMMKGLGAGIRKKLGWGSSATEVPQNINIYVDGFQVCFRTFEVVMKLTFV